MPVRERVSRIEEKLPIQMEQELERVTLCVEDRRPWREKLDWDLGETEILMIKEWLDTRVSIRDHWKETRNRDRLTPVMTVQTSD